jgi:hypothetical protein
MGRRLGTIAFEMALGRVVRRYRLGLDMSSEVLTDLSRPRPAAVARRVTPADCEPCMIRRWCNGKDD